MKGKQMQAFKASYLQLRDNEVVTKIIGAGTFSGAAKKAEREETVGSLELQSLERTDDVIL